MPLTTPLAETVTTAVFDDCHVARTVTSSVVPSERVTAAPNWAVSPIAGAVPVTTRAVIVGVEATGAGEPVDWTERPPQASDAESRTATARARRSEASASIAPRALAVSSIPPDPVPLRER